MKSKKTSPRVAKISAKVLKDKKQDKPSKSAAGSALAQAEGKKKKKK
jgi:hypothetical protein